MSRRAIVPAALIQHQSNNPIHIPLVQETQPASSSRRVSYGATSSTGSGSGGGSPHRFGKGKEPDVGDGAEDEGEDADEFLDVTWKYMSRLYLLVPIITLIFLVALVLLVTYAWPPNAKERKAGQQYPHPFLWKPLAIGIFASCTVQTLRIPIWVLFSWLGTSPPFTTILSTTIHTILHELLRLSTIPLLSPSPTSGFHSSYYLGLGWGVAEAAWGIVQGWEQMSLYEDVMKPEPFLAGLEGMRSENEDRDENEEREGLMGVNACDEEDRVEQRGIRDDEAELERKVEILERMRGRRDLEEVIGVPFPTIPFPLHLLWRLDTLLLNLGLTLILSASYYDSAPIYRHSTPSLPSPIAIHKHVASIPKNRSSPYLPLVVVLVCLVHVAVNLVWKVVGRLGVGAVTWGGLIVALGSVFAGLGAWGGLV